VNTRCVVISGECHENPCKAESCNDNLCISSTEGCLIDPCGFRRPTDAECGATDGCVVKSVGNNLFCKSGGCEYLKDRVNCGINGKCVYSKETCIYDSCKGLSENNCKENKICSVDSNNNCVFDLCSEGSYLSDDGIKCSSLTGCGYEKYDDICKVATSTFTDINIGSVQGVV
jgi:hypothetical protein